jgi:hypothetical protein
MVDKILQQLTPEQHAIGCVFVLNVKANNISPASGVSECDAVFVQQVKRLMMMGDAEQLRFARRQVCDICRVFTHHCRLSVPTPHTPNLHLYQCLFHSLAVQCQIFWIFFSQ